MGKRRSIVWLDDPVFCEVVNGIAVGIITSGNWTLELRAEPKTLLSSARNMLGAYGNFAGKAAVDVVRFDRKKKGKH